MAVQNTRLGIWLMVVTTLIFAIQDGVSRYLGQFYSPLMIATIRYWFFAACVIVMALRDARGWRAAVATPHLGLQIFRGVALASQICLMLYSFVQLGLVNTHSVASVYPLIVTALSVPLLGEKVGLRRWLAIAVGLCGVLIILRPDAQAITPEALVALAAAVLFALYGIATRYVGRNDTAQTSLFYTGIVGAIVLTPLGLYNWVTIQPAHMLGLGFVCLTGMTAHWLMIRAYEVAEASAIQPLSYLQLVHVTLIGVYVFGEVIGLNVVIGTLTVVAAGLFTILRGAQVAKRG